MNNYGNCSSFKICNETDDFLKYNENHHREKDYPEILMSTPPSNVNKDNKYGIIGNSTHNGIPALFSCTPKDDNLKSNNDENIKPTTSFNHRSLLN